MAYKVMNLKGKEMLHHIIIDGMDDAASIQFTNDAYYWRISSSKTHQIPPAVQQ
jgi:hypothetical protein